jgi:hypothetical protein
MKTLFGNDHCDVERAPSTPLDLVCGYIGVKAAPLRFHLDERAGRYAVSGAGLPTMEAAAKFSADEVLMTMSPGGVQMGWVVNRRDLTWGDAGGMKMGKCKIVGSDKTSF